MHIYFCFYSAHLPVCVCVSFIFVFLSFLFVIFVFWGMSVGVEV